jgi:hypothetical protein
MENKKDEGFQKLGDLFANRQKVKPPAYQWQDLALRVISELRVPGFKRASVFKACKNNSKDYIEKCLNETKELCKTGECWKYFFKVLSDMDKKITPEE